MNPLPEEFSQVFFRAARPVTDWPWSFAIVTACNPCGKVVSAAENERADSALAVELVARGVNHSRITGGSRDGAHLEPGWGIETADESVALELCRRFDQLAYFQVERGEITLVDVASGTRQPAGSWTDRLLA